MHGPTIAAPLSRRTFLKVNAAAAAGLALGCKDDGPAGPRGNGRITVRPSAPTVAPYGPGTHQLPVGPAREALLYVPVSVDPSASLRLLVSLHGSGGTAAQAIPQLSSTADTEGFLVLAVTSFHQTWDVIVDAYGTDVDLIGDALTETFARFTVDPARIALSGFSDGASYALSLGTVNGDLFSKLIAFSPGFAALGERNGTPRIFISHGTQDTVLPIGPTSRTVVPRLRGLGYDVTYEEFNGGHTIPSAIRTSASAWLMAMP